MPIRRKPGEKKDEFISRCIAKEVQSGMKEDQAAAVCYAYWEDKQLSAVKKIRNQSKDKWIERFFEKNDIGVHMSELGLSEEDFTDEYKFDIDELEFEKFEIQEKDATDNTKLYYRYEHRTAGPNGGAERPFCKTLMDKTKSKLLFSYEDIVDLNTAPKGGRWKRALRSGGGNYSIFKYRGGVNCQHKWVAYKYDVEKKELVKARTQPRQNEVGRIKK